MTAKLSPAEELVAAQDEIVDTFALLEDWTDRYQYLIDLGRQMPPLPAWTKSSSNSPCRKMAAS